jgi:hypothetical protein
MAPDPAPTKRCGSLRLRLRNTGLYRAKLTISGLPNLFVGNIYLVSHVVEAQIKIADGSIKDDLLNHIDKNMIILPILSREHKITLENLLYT